MGLQVFLYTLCYRFANNIIRIHYNQKEGQDEVNPYRRLASWKNIEGHSRLEEQRLFLKDFINICEEEQADIIIIAGDIYDNYNPSAMAEQLFYDTLKQLSRNGDCMTVVIAGNHDNPERLVASGPLARDHGIVIAGTPNSVITPGMYGKNEITESDAGYIHAIIHGKKRISFSFLFQVKNG